VIYTTWAEPVEIVAFAGKHPRRGDKLPMLLVRVKRLEEPRDEFHAFVHTLRADGSVPEIDAAVDAAPEVVLTARDLRQALKEAE
jgi:hypothetical protein